MAAEKKPGVFTGPLWTNNPVVVQVLGICSALAVTTQMKPALVMGISLTCVLAFANVIISLLRKTIPNRIRIIVQLVVVAALVIIVNQMMARQTTRTTFMEISCSVRSTPALPLP